MINSTTQKNVASPSLWARKVRVFRLIFLFFVRSRKEKYKPQLKESLNSCKQHIVLFLIKERID